MTDQQQEKHKQALLAILHLMAGKSYWAKEYAAQHGLDYDEEDDYSLACSYQEDARYRYPKRNALARDIAFHALGKNGQP